MPVDDRDFLTLVSRVQQWEREIERVRFKYGRLIAFLSERILTAKDWKEFQEALERDEALAFPKLPLK